MILGSYTKGIAKNSKIWICHRLPKIASDPNVVSLKNLGVKMLPCEGI
jgi:hypothetical protein